MSGGPILLVGLDVGDGRLVLDWARDGRLPVLASLLARGTWTWLDTPAAQLHVSGWPSLYTGAHPGEHGVYYTFQPAAGQQGWRKFSGGLYGRPTVWNLLSQAGVRCTVFDAPYTHTEPDSRATQVFEWGVWARHWRPMSTPAALFRRLVRACGRYPLGLEALDLGLGGLDAEMLRPRLVAAAHAKAEAAAWLMRERAWDLFVVVFGETHPAAHYCWRTPPHRAGSACGDEQTGMREIYEAIDRGIGRLLREVGDGVTVAVVSTDGVGPNVGAWHLLPEVLRRLGVLVEPAPPAPNAGQGRRRWDPVRRLRDALPKDFRKSLARRLPDALRQRLALRVDTAAIDWSRTRAYCLPTDLEGYVRVNLRGREPLGIVAPGDGYRRVCDDVAAALAALVDPATGRPAVREVIRTDERFPGARRSALPDLIVVWEREGPLHTLASPAIGTVSGPSPDGRPGTHAPPGFLLQCGPAGPLAGPVEGGTFGAEAATHATGHVTDVAPRLLAHFGVPVPAHLSRGTPCAAPQPFGARS